MPAAPAHHYQQTYSNADLSALARSFNIPPNLINIVGEALEDAAAIWRWHSSGVQERSAPSHAAQALRDLAKFSEKLNATLTSLPPRAIEALNAQLTQADHAIIMGAETFDGLPVLMVPNDDGSSQSLTPSLADYVHLVDALARMADHAAQFPPGRKGAKRDHALRMWMANIEPLWAQTLGRPFMRDALSDGTPLTPAAEFCVAAFAFVDPQTPKSRIMNEMKLRIRANRRKSTGRISSKIDG